jgi:hypothetical protein
VSILAVIALTCLMACQQPGIVSRKKTDGQTTSIPAGEIPPFTLFYNGKTASLSPFETLASSNRSLSGYDRDSIMALGLTHTFNYFEWILMDADEDGIIYAYDEATINADSDNADSGTPAEMLSTEVKSNHTYHILLLAGNKVDSENPTLLASAYTKFKADSAAPTLDITLIPIVVDLKFTGGPDGDRQVGRLAKTVGLDAGRTYSLEYVIGSADKGVKAEDDALKVALNDGMWPLKLATKEKRNDDTWFYKYSAINPDTKVRETLGTYQPGVLDIDQVPLNNTSGANLAYVQWHDGDSDDGSDDSIQGMNDQLANSSHATTGRGVYEFKTTHSQVGMTGTVWFHLEYVPFGVFDNTAWAAVNTARPVWVIRNGLNDHEQDASSWEDGVKLKYHGGAGGIAIGVVEPTAPFTSGLFEDNNPWPVANTETVDKALIALDTGLGATKVVTVDEVEQTVNSGAGYGRYSIKQEVSEDLSLPSMKLTADGGNYDHTAGDGNGLTFTKLGNLKTPLSIAITSDGPQRTLYLNELGSMF